LILSFSLDALRDNAQACNVERRALTGIQLAHLLFFRTFAAHPRFTIDGAIL